jgi:hypothetical protein
LRSGDKNVTYVHAVVLPQVVAKYPLDVDQPGSESKGVKGNGRHRCRNVFHPVVAKSEFVLHRESFVSDGRHRGGGAVAVEVSSS